MLESVVFCGKCLSLVDISVMFLAVQHLWIADKFLVTVMFLLVIFISPMVKLFNQHILGCIFHTRGCKCFSRFSVLSQTH